MPVTRETDKQPSIKKVGRHAWILHLIILISIFFFMFLNYHQKRFPLSPEEKAWLRGHNGQIVLLENTRRPPLEFVNEYGQWTGIASEFVDLIEKRLGIKFKRVRETEFPETLELIRTGKVDVVCNIQKTSFTAERLLFTEQYLTLPLAIIVRKEIKGSLRLDRMLGMSISVVQGSYSEEFIQKKFKARRLDLVANPLEGLRRVAFHQSDAMVVNLAVASYLIESEGLINLHLAGTAGETDQLCLASRKDLPILNRILVKGLSQISPKEKQDIIKRWIRLDRSVFIYDAKFWYIAGTILITALSGTLIILTWNRMLKSQVAQKTRELQKELAERKIMERQLLETEKIKAVGTFAAGVAHDFNNTLNSIIGYAEMMELFDVTPGTRLEHRLKQVLHSSYRAKGLVQQILAFSRQTKTEMMPVILNPIAREITCFLEASLPANVQIVKTCKTENDVILADPTQPYRIIMNLCTNAAQAMNEKGGAITLKISEATDCPEKSVLILDPAPGPYVLISVTDTGMGMDPDTIKHIFEPFFTTKKHSGGTGMGLSVVHGIVKELGGTITVESGVGEGSRFQVFLPMFQGDLSTEATEKDVLMSPQGGSILFVDDDEQLAEFAKENLNQFGYDVTVCHGGMEALQIYSDNPNGFDLVIADYGLPDISGLELATMMVNIRSDISILLCSGYSPTFSPEQMEQAGVRRFIQKPIGAYELIHVVRQELKMSAIPTD